MALPEVCVCYLVRETARGPEVLLGRKKTGLGRGKLVGPGGKLEADESPTDAVVREVAEEVGVVIDTDALELIGELTYPFPHAPKWSQKSWAFLCRAWEGNPTESEELRPEWYPMSALPLDQMWDDAKYWLPTALAGDRVVATFSFGRDGSTVESSDWEAV
ncbi:8-oxo-dGTP diphosphatase [Cryobacterium mesophilum]|nr:8-oxo-dGTP diphosphatase [Terrimesophilobacter mesophilus]MBB5633740.1 8-oxo-dGTP diphosphatase [Terrimesophilobacter mesophilus]